MNVDDKILNSECSQLLIYNLLYFNTYSITQLINKIITDNNQVFMTLWNENNMSEKIRYSCLFVKPLLVNPRITPTLKDICINNLLATNGLIPDFINVPIDRRDLVL